LLVSFVFGYEQSSPEILMYDVGIAIMTHAVVCPSALRLFRSRSTDKERDAESGNDYFGARYYASTMGRFMSPDPGPSHPANPQSWNRYIYGANNPLGSIDPDGREPVKAQAGTPHGFLLDMNATQHHVGVQTGAMASPALSRLGETEWSKRGLGPANTAPFNSSKNRYIYTTGYGWVDMVHFLFYAGRAYNYEQKGDANPEGHAIQDGYKQEAADLLFDSWSAYSYEDLPSDKLGALFAIFSFDPTSKLSLGEQVEAFLNGIGATDPTTAPNYAGIPNADSRNPPTARK
jgi:RHS repeat-associated protein